MARATKAAKQASHDKIVTAASEMIRENGIEGLNITAAMQAAGLTHGGFYRHFTDKNALVCAAITAAFQQFEQAIIDDANRVPPAQTLSRFVDRYLSEPHLNNPAKGCPVAALGGEIARQDAPVQQAFQAGVARLTALLDQLLAGCETARLQDGTALLAALVGGVTVAHGAGDAAAQTATLNRLKAALGPVTA